jgi:hypothetical protein
VSATSPSADVCVDSHTVVVVALLIQRSKLATTGILRSPEASGKRSYGSGLLPSALVHDASSAERPRTVPQASYGCWPCQPPAVASSEGGMLVPDRLEDAQVAAQVS